MLGCTHFPHLAPLIARVAAGRATVVAPSAAVARQEGAVARLNTLLRYCGLLRADRMDFALLVLRVRAALPYMLAFAGGAMIYVVVEELIPESHRSGKPGKIALFTLAGFALMMVLDVALSI